MDNSQFDSYKKLVRQLNSTTAPITQYNMSINAQLQDTIRAMTQDITGLSEAHNISKSYKDAIDSLTAPITQYNVSINTELQDTIRAMTQDITGLSEALNISKSYKDAIDSLTHSTYRKAFQEISIVSEFDLVQRLEEEEGQLLFLTEDEKKERIDKFVIDQIIQLIPKIDVEKYKKLSSTTQKLITSIIIMLIPALYFYGSVYLEAFRNVEVERAQKNIKTFLENNVTASDKDKIRRIKKTPQAVNFNLFNKETHRFITINGLRVRSKPSQKGEILTQLKQGKIVEIIDKKKNWIKVSYDIDNSTVEGWVFTRYTKKFE